MSKLCIQLAFRLFRKEMINIHWNMAYLYSKKLLNATPIVVTRMKLKLVLFSLCVINTLVYDFLASYLTFNIFTSLVI